MNTAFIVRIFYFLYLLLQLRGLIVILRDCVYFHNFAVSSLAKLACFLFTGITITALAFVLFGFYIVMAHKHLALLPSPHISSFFFIANAYLAGYWGTFGAAYRYLLHRNATLKAQKQAFRWNR